MHLCLSMAGLLAVCYGVDAGLTMQDEARVVQGALQPVDLHAGALGASVIAWLPWVFRRRTGGDRTGQS